VILIAITHREHTFILNAADTYLGCVTQTSGATMEEAISRAIPTMRAWAELGQAAAAARSSRETETRPKR